MRRTLVLAVFAAVVAAAPSADAASLSPVPDCNKHGALTHRYTIAQLRRGLNTMPAYVKEYTDCYDVIQRTLVAQAASPRTDAGNVGGAGSASGGPLLPTPLIVALALLALLASALGVIAIRRRHAGD